MDDLLEHFVKLCDVLLIDYEVDVVDLVLDRLTLFQDLLVLRQISPVFHVPVVLYQHFLVLQGVSDVSVLIPFVKHLETLNKKIIPYS